MEDSRVSTSITPVLTSILIFSLPVYIHSVRLYVEILSIVGGVLVDYSSFHSIKIVHLLTNFVWCLRFKAGD